VSGSFQRLHTPHSALPGPDRVHRLGTILVLVGLALIALATLTPAGRADSPRVTYCINCGIGWLTDIVSNVVLFTPLGAGLAMRGVPVRRAILAAFAASLAVEVCQFLGYPPGRTSALADLLANVSGTALAATIVSHRGQLLRPRHAVAVAVTVTWSSMASATLLLSGFALGLTAGDDTQEPSILLSRLETVPDMPWFQDQVDWADVNGVRINRGSPGPVIMEAVGAVSTFRASVSVRGRDVERVSVPVLSVHRPGAPDPVLLIGQLDDDLEIRSPRRANDFGLVTPHLRLRGAFAARAPGDGRSTSVDADVTGGVLRLSARSDEFADTASLIFQPTIGWALLQTVASADERFAQPITLAWLLLLTFPIGWFSMHIHRGRLVISVSALLGIVISGYMASVLADIAPIDALGWTGLLGFTALGGLFGLRSRRQH